MDKLVIRTAIRKRCLGCAGSSQEVKTCDRTDCHLYEWRLGKHVKGESSARRKAVRDYCTWCCADSVVERSKCPVTYCPLWEFRTGTRKS